MSEDKSENGETKEKAEDELSVTLAEAVRPPEKTDIENAVASKLVLAILSSDRLQMITSILECYKLLPPETAEELFAEEERDEFDRLYEVAISFLQMYEESSGNPYDPARWVCIPWGFSWMVADRYLYWVTREWDLPFSDWQEFKEYLSKLDSEKRKAEYLRALCQALYKCSMSLAKQVLSEFIVYAMPIASKIMRNIFAGGIVSASTWNETLLLMRGGGKTRQQ